MHKMRGINLTLEMVERAASEVALIVRSLAEEGVLRGFMGHFVVMNPSQTFEELPFGSPDDSFRMAILHEGSFVDDAYRWNHDYEKIARAKARASWETGLSSRELMALHPTFAKDGDAPWAGSIVVKLFNGQIVVIAFSGLPSEDDEWVCRIFWARLQALAHKRISDNTLVGGESVEIK